MASDLAQASFLLLVKLLGNFTIILHLAALDVINFRKRLWLIRDVDWLAQNDKTFVNHKFRIIRFYALDISLELRCRFRALRRDQVFLCHLVVIMATANAFILFEVGILQADHRGARGCRKST